jgi:hypothetical protein
MHHVVAHQGADRDEFNVENPEPRRELSIVGHDPLEHGLRIVDEIHLVHGDEHSGNSEKRRDERVAFGLGDDSMPGVDQNDGQVRRRRTRRHVSRVLLVSRRIRDDEMPLLRREISVGHIDRDLLLALRLEAVGQQREVDGGPSPETNRVCLKRAKMVLVHTLGVVEQAADQRRFAIVDASHRREPEQVFGLALIE